MRRTALHISSRVACEKKDGLAKRVSLKFLSSDQATYLETKARFKLFSALTMKTSSRVETTIRTRILPLPSKAEGPRLRLMNNAVEVKLK